MFTEATDIFLLDEQIQKPRGGAILGTVDSAISTIGRRLHLLVSTSNILTLDVQWRTASGLND